MEIGVQTKGLIPETTTKKAYGMIAEAGFSRVDFNIDAFLLNSDVYGGNINSFFEADMEALYSYFSSHKVEMARAGIKASQMHAPYPIWVVQEKKKNQNDFMQGTVIPKSILVAEYLDIPYVVVHPAKIQKYLGIKDELEWNIDYFSKLIPLLKETGVKICFENLYDSVGTRIVEGVGDNPKDVLYMINTLNDRAGEECFGFCLDTGHLQLIHRDPYDFIIAMGDHLKILHIHENNGTDDIHQIPFTFGYSREMGFDWSRFIEALREIKFDGTLSFETFPAVKSFPFDQRQTVLNTIYQIGQYLKDEITK